MDFKPIGVEAPQYWEGSQNILIRLWTYIKIGLAQVNEFKYVGAAIFGAYYTLKLTNPLWIVAMTAISIPALCLIGRWWLYKGAKTSEFVTTQRGSVIGYGNWNMQVQQTEFLKEIRDALKHD